MDTVAAVSIEQLIDMLIACVIFTALTTSIMILSDVSSVQEAINANIAVVDDYIIDSKYAEKIIYAQDVIALFMETQGKVPIEFNGEAHIRKGFERNLPSALSGATVHDETGNIPFYNLEKLQEIVDYSKKYASWIVYDKYNRLAYYHIEEALDGTIPDHSSILPD